VFFLSSSPGFSILLRIVDHQLKTLTKRSSFVPLDTMKIHLLSIILVAPASLTFAQTDDFNDGNSSGWTEVDPLSGVVAPGTYSFPGGNTYRMQGVVSPNQEVLGPSRIGALRQDVSYTDFYQTIDVVDFDQTLDQNVGLLARVKEPGLGTLDGYSFTYNPFDQHMFFSVITDEEGTNLADIEVLLDPGTPVRLVLQGNDDAFKCEVFALSDLTTPVAVMETSDTTWTTGTGGIFVVADENESAQPTDCTFDNYFAAAEKPENPTEVSIVSFEIDGEELVIEFSSRAGESYGVWNSPDLVNWQEVEDSIAGEIGPTTAARVTNPDPEAKKQFFEVRKE